MTAHRIIIITAPSGSGKTTLVKDLLKRIPHLSFSVSACTRPPRAEEINGKDYYFLSSSDFKKKIENDEFLEWQMVYPGKYYGTLKSEMERIWKNKQFPIVDIDVQGALRVKKQFDGESLSLFIMAPSLSVLEQRLRSRGTESEGGLHERLKKANEELQLASKFDFILVNDNLAIAEEQLFKKVSSFVQS